MRLGPAVQDAVVGSNGHVLLTTARAVYDWAPGEPPREAFSGDDVYAIYVAPGAARFAVLREGKDRRSLELWDAETFVKVRDLGGGAHGEESSPRLEISRDRSRLLYGECAGTGAGADGALQCDAAIYALASGDLVHRTKFPSMTVQGYVPVMALSPTGRYVSVESPLVPSELRDSDTGALVLRVNDGRWGDLDDSGVRLLWLGETRLLASTDYGRTLSLRELPAPPGRTASTRTVRPATKKQESASEPVVSPDQSHVAVVTELLGGTELFVWSLEANTDATHGHPVPQSICIDRCVIDWVSDHEVSVHSDDPSPPTSLFVDATTNVEKVLPYRAAPFYSFGGFSLFGDFRASSTAPRMSARARDYRDVPSTGPSAVRVVTKTGASVDLGHSERSLGIAVFGDRIVVLTTEAVSTVTASGVLHQLGRPPARP